MRARELTWIVLLACAGGVVSSATAQAAAGDLDRTFGGDGIVTSRFGTDRALAVQGNGRVVVAGKRSSATREAFALARYRSNGTLDPTFSSDGKVATRFPNRRCVGVDALAIVPGGKIVAAGRSGCVGGKFAIARYLPDGRLDRTFSGDGKVTTSFGTGCRFAEPAAVTIQINGRAVVAGRNGCMSGGALVVTFAVARYKLDGRLDRSFSGDGRLTTDFSHAADHAYDVIVQPADDKVVVAGTANVESFDQARFALARYTRRGIPDPSFGAGGRITTGFTGVQNCEEWAQAYALARQPQDGRLVVAGKTGCGGHPNFALVRYTTRGLPDSTFGEDGRVATRVVPDDCSAVINDIAISSDGGILAGGTAGCRDPHPSFALARYRKNGTLDPAFGGDGKVTATLRKTGDCFDQINAIGLHAGKISAVGPSGCVAGGAAALLRFRGG